MKKARHHQPPRDGIIFVKMWNSLLPRIASRTDFDETLDLLHLEILCSLYEDNEKLSNVIEVLGRTYTTEGGRNGKQIRVRPELAQLNTARNQIKSYLQMLRLITVDKVEQAKKPADKVKTEEWT